MAADRAEDTQVTADLHASKGGPTVMRILLGAHLRRLREAKGVAREDAGFAIRASHAKISRIERGQVSFKQRDVQDLLTLYGITDPEERGALLALVSRANTHGWWQTYRDVLPNWFNVYMGLEEAASVIRTFEVQFVPGLLQTEDYARSVIRLSRTATSDSDIDSRVAMRGKRQRRLVGPDAPRLWAVMDEAALRRPYGDAQVMRAQIDHLIEMAALPNVTLQVIPFSSGGHPAAGGPFTILRFPSGQLPDVVFLEQLNSAHYLDKYEDTYCYAQVMDHLSTLAPVPSSTPGFLEALREDFA